jgi:carboxyl-terminal processing protease
MMPFSKANILGSAVVFIIAAFFVGVYVGEHTISDVEKVTSLVNKNGDALSAQVGAQSEVYDFGPYWRVWNTLERKFIPFSTTTEEVTAEDRMYRSIEGLVDSYNDPYTVFMRPQVSEDFKIATKGSLEGIGAVIGEREGGLIIVSPLQDSPADKAGLLPLDRIYSVDGVDVTGMTVEDAVNLIRGEGGTEVLLTIQTGDTEPRDVSIIRGTIEIPSTAHAVIEREVPKVAVHTNDTSPPPSKTDGSTNDEPIISEPTDEPVETEVKDFYQIRLFSFSQTSINAFERELKNFVSSGSDSLIIDLRGNPGGFIESAVQIASWFLNEGDVVVRELSGPLKQERIHRAYNKTLFEDKRPNVVVLVDKSSASASEILAGALQEYDIATIVGTQTFGKGSVQELVNITNDLSLKVTVARWYTPNGLSISENGLTPDVVVDPSTATSSDPWIDAAITTLSTG